MSKIEVVKDDKNQQPIPSVWRPIFSNIVSSFVVHDYFIGDGLRGVAPVSTEIAQQIQEYIESYGEKLIELPEESWDSSICIWMGNHWDVLIDLWTENEGRSDLVINAQVTEANQGYLVNIYMVYVP